MNITVATPQIPTQRCVVLGGKGFMGSHLVETLLARGCFVRVFDRPNVVSMWPCGIDSAVDLVEGDFASESETAAAVDGCEVCFHLVSTVLPKSSNLDPVFDIETNLTATVRLLNHCVSAGVKKVIFLSSGGTVYGRPSQLPIDETHPTDPICSYGITKLATEKYLHLYHELHGLDFTVLRLSNPFGERQRTHLSQGAVANFLGKALRGENVEIWGDGSVVRDYLYVSDAVNAMVAAMLWHGPNRVFNIGSGEGRSLNEVLAAIELVLGRTVKRSYTEGRVFDVPANVLAIARAQRDLGWLPRTSFFQGLERMARWVAEQTPV